MNVCPVLKSLPQMGRLRSRARSSSAGVSVVRLRSAVGERNSAFERRVSVDLAGRDLRIVLRQPAFEILEGLMHRAGAMEHLGRRAPDHHQPRRSRGASGTARMSSISISAFSIFVRGLLDVGPVDAADVLRIEDGLHRPDGRERLFELLEQSSIEHRGVQRGLIRGVFDKCPSRRRPGRSTRPAGQNP